MKGGPQIPPRIQGKQGAIRRLARLARASGSTGQARPGLAAERNAGAPAPISRPDGGLRIPPHEHDWQFRSDIPVRDFGSLGIKTYECRECGALGESDPETGAVTETAE